MKAVRFQGHIGTAHGRTNRVHYVRYELRSIEQTRRNGWLMVYSMTRTSSLDEHAELDGEEELSFGVGK